MKRSTTRLIALFATLPALMIVFAIGYMLAMTHLEGIPRDFWSSLEWASETLTTTGYGRDAHWEHPLVVIFVVIVQIIGIFVVFLIFPIYLIPFFEERFESKLPTALPKVGSLPYVLIFHYNFTVSTLIEELLRHKRRVIILEENQEIGRRLQDQNLEVVHMHQPLNEFNFQGITGASAIIANGADYDNAALLLVVRDHGFTGPVHALIDNPLHRQPLFTWGAATVYTPAHVSAAALASRASRNISPIIQGVQQLGKDLGVAELRIHDSSPLAGLTIAQANLRNKFGIVVLGYWNNGIFISRPVANTPLTPGNIMIVIGSQSALEHLNNLVVPLQSPGAIIVAGYGEVGHKVVQMLADAGEEVTTVDRDSKPGVNIIGNVLDQTVLEQAGACDAKAIVLALGNDSETLFAATVVREIAPAVPLLAHVKQPQTVSRIYRVGADFALSTSQVAGQLLAQHLLGEAYISVEHDLKLVKFDAKGLVGQHPFKIGILEHTGCQVVAIERNLKVLVQFSDDFIVDTNDTVFLSGSPSAIASYNSRFRASK
ncbi:hypothetical protein TI04_03870 [Achromatium sp. WMS2]|nr:hypothetical protein TI04_03870 [Achromatium sp. WMS2]